MSEDPVGGASQEKIDAAQQRLRQAESDHTRTREEVIAARAYLDGLRAGNESDAAEFNQESVTGAAGKEDSGIPLQHHVANPPSTQSRGAYLFGIFAVSALGSLVLHWLSQITIGAFLGGIVGADGVFSIADDELAGLDSVTTFSTIFTTVVVTLVNTSTAEMGLEKRGDLMLKSEANWWKHCWVGVLLGTIFHAVVFGFGFVSITT